MTKLSSGASSTVLAKRFGLQIVSREALKLRRRRCGMGWSYLGPRGRQIEDAATIRRLRGLAVPPAYKNVRYAENPNAHLQAIGRDAAGRLQYRYHPEWERVREARKALRLGRLATALPRIRRSLGQHLAAGEPTRTFVCAAVIELVACTAIRPGNESYLRLHRTRGATTLLKSNVTVDGKSIQLSFRSKGGKIIVKAVTAPRLAKAIRLLKRQEGTRLFQYITEKGETRNITVAEVNAFLREIAGVRISLKDFRTLLASAQVLEALAKIQPATSERQRRKQIKGAVGAAADHLANTPAICRRSYVHDAVVEAFEDGTLAGFSSELNGKSSIRSAQALAEVVAKERVPSKNDDLMSALQQSAKQS